MKHRYLLSIAIVFMLLALTSCSSGPQAPVATPMAPTAEPTEAPVVSNVRYTSDGRRIITIGTWYDRFYVSKHQAIEDDPKMIEEETALMRLENMRSIEEKYPIYLDSANLTFEGLRESIETSIPEGSPDVDLYEVDLQFGIPAVLKNYAISLESLDLADSDAFAEQNVMTHLNLVGQGESYLFAPSRTDSLNVYALAFNMDMVREAGLENPQDLYDRGEWTWDVWRDYLKKLTKTNTDGITDVYGYSGYWTHLLRNLLYSNGAGIATGQTETLSSPQTLEVLEFIDSIYNLDKTARPWDESNWDINNELYAEGKSAFWIGADWIFDEQGNADLPFEIGVVPWPCGPSGDKETNKQSMPQSNWFFIPVGTEDPRLIYDVLYDWTNWYHDDPALAADRKWTKSMYMNERNYAYAEMMASKPGLDLWDSLGVNLNLLSMLKAEITPADVVEATKQHYQDALDNYFG